LSSFLKKLQILHQFKFILQSLWQGIKCWMLYFKPTLMVQLLNKFVCLLRMLYCFLWVLSVPLLLQRERLSNKYYTGNNICYNLGNIVVALARRVYHLISYIESTPVRVNSLRSLLISRYVLNLWWLILLTVWVFSILCGVGMDCYSPIIIIHPLQIEFKYTYTYNSLQSYSVSFYYLYLLLQYTHLQITSHAFFL